MSGVKKVYGVRRLINEFPNKKWSMCGELSEAIANNGVPLNEHPVVDFHAR